MWIKHASNRSNLQGLDFDELWTIADRQLNYVATLNNLTELEKNDVDWASNQLKHLIPLLDERIEQQKAHCCSLFTLCYTGNTGETNIKADAKLGLTLKSVKKFGGVLD